MMDPAIARMAIIGAVEWMRSLRTSAPEVFAAMVAANGAQRDGPEPPDPCQPIPPGTPPEETACREEACIILTLGLAACNSNQCRKAWNDWYAAEIAACGQS